MRFPPLPIAASLLLCSCAAVPNLGEKPQIVAPESLASSASLTGIESQWPTDGWWQGFGDPALDGLIEEGLKGSPDIAIAAARVRSAEALAQQAGAALLPTAGAEASAGGVQQSKNMGIPPAFVPDGIQDTGKIAASISFDLDLWSKNRAALAAATSEAKAAEVDLAQARLMLSTGVAAAYADLAGYYQALDVAKDAVRIRSASADIAAKRTGAGLDNMGSQRQAESRVPSAKADVAALEEAIKLTQNRIAALLGAGPDRGLSIGRPTLTAPSLGIPAQAGIELIGRRPDIVAARLRAEAAEKQIDVTRADFYPNIKLSALVGLQSLGLGNLFSTGSEYGNGGAAITLPIFDGGRVAGRYRNARAGYDAAVATYDKTLTTALREVADTIASRNSVNEQLQQMRASLSAADEAARVAGMRYRAGLTNQLGQLTAEDSAVAIRRSVAQLEARKLALDITLIRALGGGFQAAPISGE